jgi:type I restriction enzyme M protein
MACCSVVPLKAKSASSSSRKNLLDAVIGLPANLFYGTGIPAAVLVFKRNKTDNKVLFIDASREYQNDKNQNRLRQADIDKIVATYQARETIDKYAYLASFEEIKENDFNPLRFIDEDV